MSDGKMTDDEKAAEEYAERHAVRTDGGGWEETTDYKEQEAAFLAGIAHARKWHRYPETKPDEGDIVLVRLKDGELHVARLLAFRAAFNGNDVETFCWGLLDRDLPLDEVTHWQPIHLPDRGGLTL